MVSLIEREGTWERQGQPQRIFDAYVTNKGSCSISSNSLHAYMTLPAGSFMGTSWGYNLNSGEILDIPAIDVGQSYSGFGFIVSGILSNVYILFALC